MHEERQQRDTTCTHCGDRVPAGKPGRYETPWGTYCEPECRDRERTEENK